MMRFRAALIVSVIVAGSVGIARAASDPLAIAFVRAIATDDLGAFRELAEDSRQLRERDWVAVARWVDHHPCTAVNSFASEVVRAADDAVELRIEVDADQAVTTWTVIAVRTPLGYRIRSTDDAPTHAAKGMLFAQNDIERAAILSAAEASFAEIVEAF